MSFFKYFFISNKKIINNLVNNLIDSRRAAGPSLAGVEGAAAP